MTLVSRFEADLLRLLPALLGLAPIDGVLSILVERRVRPSCLGRPALALIGESLAKGVALRLARSGGWHAERHVRGDRVVAGRLWERTPPEALGLTLHFSPHTLDLLLALIGDPPDAPPRPATTPEPPTVGDRVFALFAYEALRLTTFARPALQRPGLRDHALIRLLFPDDCAEASVADAPDLAPWLTTPGAEVVEALAPLIAARWAEMELAKARISDRAVLTKLARAQTAILAAFLDAVDAAGRRDLARPLLAAAAAVLLPGRTVKDWFAAGLTDGLGLAERLAVRREALSLLAALDRLRRWDREARLVGYFDDGYAAAQLSKADWEALDGDALAARADALRRELDPLAS